MNPNSLEAALDHFGAMAPGAMYLHHVQVLLFIYRHGSTGCLYRDIEEKFNLTNASVTRTVGTLSDKSNHRTRTLGLVETFNDPEEKRRYRVRLTAKGKAQMRVLQDRMDGSEGHLRLVE